MQRVAKIVCLVSLALPWYWFYGRPIIQGESFAFRDSAHYYYPLWKLVADSWRGTLGRTHACEPPLWNPFDNLGQPLAADSTAAVFYPGNWLLLTPLPYPIAFKLTIALHALGAAAVMLLVARQRGTSWSAATLAALSYAFGGYAVAQHANPPYLIGAMWLPLVMHHGERALRQGTWNSTCSFAACLAMMVLGGDPQSAYHAVLMLLLAAVVLPRHLSPKPGSPLQTVDGVVSIRGGRAFAVGVLCAAALAAVQILPSAQLASLSTRGAYDAPRSVWESLQDWYESEPTAAQAEALTEADEHAQRIYQFSVPPWRLVELLWPNFSGRTHPIYSRWTRAAFAEQQVWNPSLYLGLLPLILAAIAVFRFSERERRWFAIVALFALLSSFGGERFSLYWLEVKLLPGYAMFRYPAKWLLFFSWAVSLLAAKGWDDYGTGRTRIASRLIIPMIVGTFCVLVASRLLYSRWETLIERAAADRVFGPLDGQQAWRIMQYSLLHHLLMASFLLVLLKPANFPRAPVAIGLLLLSAADLTVAHAGQIVTVADQLLERPSSAWRAIERTEGMANERRPIRVWRQIDRPSEWARQSSADRMQQVVAWDRDTLFPKYHLLDRNPSVVQLALTGSLIPLDRGALLEMFARQHSSVAFKSILGPQVRITNRSGGANGAQRVADAAFLARTNAGAPRAWAAFDYKLTAPPPTNRRLADWRTWGRSVVEASEDHERVPVIHSKPPHAFRIEQGPSTIIPASCFDRSLNCVEVTVRMPREGLLVLRDGYFPGWRATIASGSNKREAAVVRVNGVSRGVFLEQGEYKVVFRYRPWAFRAGLLISGAAWTWAAAILSLALLGTKKDKLKRSSLLRFLLFQRF